MFDERLFRSKVVLHGLTLAKLAEKMGINEATLHGKLKRHGAFSRDEISMIRCILDLSDDDTISIFFAQELENTQEEVI